MIMKNTLIKLFACSCVVALMACGGKKVAESNMQYVDPMIGTGGHGHTFPGATLPFGMVQLSPSNTWKAWDWCAGYNYIDSTIKGFAHNHISGAGLSGLGDILLMPTIGDLKLQPGTDEDPDSGYRSRFSHDNEKATPGYYSVLLSDYNINVELTTSIRVGFHRYTFNESGMAHIIIDPTHNTMETTMNSGVEILSDKAIRGFKKSNGAAGVRTVYFYAEFSKPFENAGVAVNDEVIEGKKAEDVNTRAFVDYNVKKGEQIEAKVALSYVSYEGAKKNFDAEAVNVDFDKALANAEKIWSDKMDKIEINGTLEQKRNFYTGLYHCLISPNIISDVDGNYVVEGKQYHSDFDMYSNFSTWDTYRALHPLLTIIEQDKTKDFVNSLTSRYTVSKVGLPGWELLGFDNVCMIGYNAVAPMAEAIMKDIPGIDVENAYDAMRAAAFSLEKHSPNYGNNGMQYYIKSGWVPAESKAAVSKTTEQNYHDWAISKVATKLGKTDDAKLFADRSKKFLELYNPETKYLWPKNLDGTWAEMDTTNWESLIPNYVSGNIWAYSGYTPHYMAGMIDKMGGKKQYEAWLDKIIADTTTLTGGMHVDISGFIGKYGHGDEPGHQMPYSYNFVGAPWKTQKLIHDITTTQYADTPDGLVNNEDLGQMSAWYVFSTLGFYPVNPVSLQYVIGSPHFTESTIHMENGKTFKVIAHNASDKNIYIQSAKLNGKDYNLPYINHSDIVNGGVIEFEMGDQPSKWASSEEVISQLEGNTL